MAIVSEEQLRYPEGEKPPAERQPQKPDWADTLIEGYEFQGPEAIKAGLVKEAEEAGEEVESFIDQVATVTNPETRQVGLEPGLETLKQDQAATTGRELEDANEKVKAALQEFQQAMAAGTVADQGPEIMARYQTAVSEANVLQQQKFQAENAALTEEANRAKAAMQNEAETAQAAAAAGIEAQVQRLVQEQSAVAAERAARIAELERRQAESQARIQELTAQKAKLDEEFRKQQEAQEAEVQARQAAMEAPASVGAVAEATPAVSKEVSPVAALSGEKAPAVSPEVKVVEAKPAVASEVAELAEAEAQLTAMHAEEMAKPAEEPVGTALALVGPEATPAAAMAEVGPKADASAQPEAAPAEAAGEKKEGAKERSVGEQVADIKAGILGALPGLFAAVSAMDFKAVKSGYRRMMVSFHEDKFTDPAVKVEAGRLNKIMNDIDGVLKNDKLDDTARAAALLNVLNRLSAEVQVVEPAATEEVPASQPEAVGEIAAEAVPEAVEAAGPEKAPKTAEQVAEDVKNVRIGIAALAQELLKNEGYLTDDMVEKFKGFRNLVDDLETGGADVKNVQEMMHHFGMILNPQMSPDAGDRLKALKEFFNENPDMAEQPKTETEEEAAARMSREAEEAFQVRQQQESIIKRREAGPKLPDLENISELLDVESTAPEVAESDFKKFFEDFAGAEYNLAVKQLDATMGQREAKIKQLFATKPESEVHKKKLQEQIACLKLANQISAVRKGQWEKQKGLHDALKALELDATSILETQDELSEVVSMLENNPNDTNLIRRKEQLEGRLNNQTDEQAGRMVWVENERKVIGSMNEQIKTGLLALRGLQGDLNKMPEEEEIRPTITATSLASPEELVQKGFANFGGMAEKGVVGLTDGMVDFMSGGAGNDVGLGNAAFGAASKMLDALAWASDKALAPLDYMAEKASGVKSPAAAKGKR